VNRISQAVGDPPIDLREYVLDHLTEAVHSQGAIVMIDGKFQIAPNVDDKALLHSLARLNLAVLEIIAQFAVEIDLLRSQDSPP
jgi:hypothetical protein